MNSTDKGPQDNATYAKIKALHLPGSEKKNFEFCLLFSYVQICDPRAGPMLTPWVSYDQTL